MSPKRNDRVAPPPAPGGWHFRFSTTAAAQGWEELCRQAAANLHQAYEVIIRTPSPSPPSTRHHRLKPPVDVAMHKGRPLPQCQFEVTSSGRVWYVVDAEQREIWLTHASTGHPKQTG